MFILVLLVIKTLKERHHFSEHLNVFWAIGQNDMDVCFQLCRERSDRELRTPKIIFSLHFRLFWCAHLPHPSSHCLLCFVVPGVLTGRRTRGSHHGPNESAPWTPACSAPTRPSKCKSGFLWHAQGWLDGEGWGKEKGLILHRGLTYYGATVPISRELTVEQVEEHDEAEHQSDLKPVASTSMQRQGKADKISQDDENSGQQ